MINEAIDEANEKIIRTTEKAITDAVGEEEAEFFNLESLKEKWVNGSQNIFMRWGMK